MFVTLTVGSERNQVSCRFTNCLLAAWKAWIYASNILSSRSGSRTPCWRASRASWKKFKVCERTRFGQERSKGIRMFCFHCWKPFESQMKMKSFVQVSGKSAHFAITTGNLQNDRTKWPTFTPKSRGSKRIREIGDGLIEIPSMPYKWNIKPSSFNMLHPLYYSYNSLFDALILFPIIPPHDTLMMSKHFLQSSNQHGLIGRGWFQGLSSKIAELLLVPACFHPEVKSIQNHHCRYSSASTRKVITEDKETFTVKTVCDRPL